MSKPWHWLKSSFINVKQVSLMTCLPFAFISTSKAFPYSLSWVFYPLSYSLPWNSLFSDCVKKKEREREAFSFISIKRAFRGANLHPHTVSYLLWHLLLSSSESRLSLFQREKKLYMDNFCLNSNLIQIHSLIKLILKFFTETLSY